MQCSVNPMFQSDDVVQEAASYVTPPEVGGTITVSKEHYFRLRLDAETLRLLEQGGVDNWEWYGDSLYRNGETLDEIEENLRLEIFGEFDLASLDK